MEEKEFGIDGFLMQLPDTAAIRNLNVCCKLMVTIIFISISSFPYSKYVT